MFLGKLRVSIAKLIIPFFYKIFQFLKANTRAINFLKDKKINANNSYEFQKSIDSLLKNRKLHGEAFNFGPNINKNYRVIDVLRLVKQYWPQASWKVSKSKKKFFENSLLNLNSQKARKHLNWKAQINFSRNIRITLDWYKEYLNKKDNLLDFTLKQIKIVNKY